MKMGRKSVVTYNDSGSAAVALRHHHAKICPEKQENQRVHTQQEVDKIKASIVSIILLDNKTGKTNRCGSGCVIDSARGIIVTGGHILRRLTFLRRKGIHSQRMTPVIEFPVQRMNRSSDGTTVNGHRHYFTAQTILCHTANNQEVCILRLEKNIDLSSSSRKCTRDPEVSEEMKKSFLAALFSCGRSKKKPNHDTFSLPLVLKPISYEQLYSMPEISIAKRTDMDDPNLVMTGYLEGRRKPFWAPSEFIKLKIDKNATAQKEQKTSSKYSALKLDTKLSIDSQMVGATCINGDGEMVGLVCKLMMVESGFACVCAASYHVASTQLVQKLLDRAQKKCDGK